MRVDLSMEAASQAVQQSQERHQATKRHCSDSRARQKGTKATLFQSERPKDHIDETENHSAHTEATGDSFGDMKVSGILHCPTKDESQQTTICPQVKARRTFVNLPVINPEKRKTAKAFVEKAVKRHKIFSVQGRCPVIRAALRARGWVEQWMQCSKQHQSSESGGNLKDADDSDDDDGDDFEDVENRQDSSRLHDLMSRMVRNERVYFYWTIRRSAINLKNLQNDQVTNHFGKACSFTTKVGLCMALKNLHWFDSVDPDTFFPRCYRIGVQEERHAFIDDYRRTACTGLLKYIVEMEFGVQGERNSHNIQCQKKPDKQHSRPLVPSRMINIALKVCQEFLERVEHNNTETSLDTPDILTQDEWTEFIDSYHRVVNGGAEIESSEFLLSMCKNMLQKLGEVSPQLDIEGTQNIWIIKPGAKSRGRGIKCAKHLDQILRLVGGDLSLINERKWVVQKYLERPFLVHGTKFDMRQWFLVTDWKPLTVWLYKKCYLRFSTQPYSLETLDSSVHLCNNSIQKHLRPSQQRHRSIPADNMWSDEQFRTFLSSQGCEAQWEAVVVPGMKSAVISALQTAQDLVESRKNTFELYGADFMLGRDLHPWLIEINSSPTMAPSTPVTARLCAAVQEDILRVVLDRRADRTANTGNFQLIYKQEEVLHSLGTNLLVEGSAIKTSCLLPPLRSSNCSASKHRSLVSERDRTAEKAKTLPNISLKTCETMAENTSSLAPTTPPLPPGPPVPVPIETKRLAPTMTVNKSVQLPITDHSHGSLLWKRRNEVSKLCT